MRLVLMLVERLDEPGVRAARARLPPPPTRIAVVVNAELLDQLYKADFIFGFAFGEQPTWLAKQLHSTHRS